MTGNQQLLVTRKMAAALVLFSDLTLDTPARQVLWELTTDAGSSKIEHDYLTTLFRIAFPRGVRLCKNVTYTAGLLAFDLDRLLEIQGASNNGS